MGDEHFALWWLGQSGFLIQWRGSHLLFDPYLSDSLTNKYAGTDKPHVRITERVIDPARLDFIDVVTSTHNHTGHLDAETLGLLLHSNPEMMVLVPAANRQFASERLQVDATRLTPIDAGQHVASGPFGFHAVPAAHEELERDEQGRYTHLGYVVRFGPWCVYHSGDTVRYETMQQQLQEFAIDVALLPINGRLPERRVPGNLSGEEAAKLAKDIGARAVVPCHFEMFEFNTVSPEPFIAAARQLDQGHAVLKCGERWESQYLDAR